MKVPKLIRGCDSSRSLFWNFFKIAGRGLLHDTACKCCVFYRGMLTAILFLAPALAAQAAEHKVLAVALGLLAGVIIAALAKVLDNSEYDDE